MAAYINVVATPTADTTGSTLVLRSGAKQYIFGAIPEGLSRTIAGRMSRMTATEEIFVTGRTRWSNTGGMLGMVLNVAESLETARASKIETIRNKITSLQSKGSSHDLARAKRLQVELHNSPKLPLAIFGPPNLMYQIAAGRRFIFRKGTPMHIREIDQPGFGIKTEIGVQPHFEDENIQVWGVSLMPSGTTVPDAPTKPSNPRKRSFEESNELKNSTDKSQTHYVLSDDLDEAAHRKLVVEGIISEMFNSGWQLDALHEIRLGDVQLPATVFVRDNTNHKVVKYCGPLSDSADPAYNPDLTVLVRRPWPGALMPSLPPTSPSPAAISYIIKHRERRGRFLPQRAKELKVPAGPKFSQLAKGMSVENEDGLLISPGQVLEESRPGNGFAVVDLPDSTYIDSLVQQSEWYDDKITGTLTVVFWTGDLQAIKDERINAFMSKLPQAQHIILSEQLTGNYLVHNNISEHNARMSVLDGQRFSIPTHDADNTDHDHGLATNVFAGNRDRVYQIEPKVDLTGKRFTPEETEPDDELEESDVPISLETNTIELAKKAAAMVQSDQKKLQAWEENVPGKGVTIITLGTGSARPSKLRNVSSTLVRVPGWGSMLFDCGEGTLGSLKRALEPEEFKQVMQELRMIAISHLHADHHLGTVNVIREWYKQVHDSQPLPDNISTLYGLQGPQLAIMAELNMHLWLDEYANVEDFGYSRLARLRVKPPRESGGPTTIHEFLKVAKSARPHYYEKKDLAMMGLKDFQAVDVDHCWLSMAFAITWPDGFKIAYSGDCRPSPDFVKIGQDSTICIHEATFDDGLIGEAIAKKHSTIGEAITVAEAMHARACILTHFSQRYTPGSPYIYNFLRKLASESYSVRAVPGISDGGPGGQGVISNYTTDMKVCAAYDLMRIKVGEIPQIKYFLPAMLDMYYRHELAVHTAAMEAAAAVSAKADKIKQSKLDMAAATAAKRTWRIGELNRLISA